MISKPVDPLKVIAAMARAMQELFEKRRELEEVVFESEVIKAFEGIEKIARGEIIPVDDEAAS